MEKAGIEYDDGRHREYLVEGENVNTRIKRPPAPKLDASTDNLVFMQLDLDFTTNKPPSCMQMGDAETTTIRMFGVTNDQNSVMVHIYNFRPYFYARLMSK
jgi:DNA polymerase delta subunit 1